MPEIEVQTSRLDRYQRLIELALDLASTLDLAALLSHIVNAAAELLGAEAASILLYDEANQQLYFEAASNLETPLMSGLVVPVESSIAGWILTERKPVIISDTHKDPRHFDRIGKVTKVETTSLLGVPLIAKDKVIGVLEAINKLSGEFNEEDQILLMALGAQAAVAIENARLFQQSDLISEFVHELRTPLTSLSAATQLIQRSEMNTEQRQSIIHTMQREINRLSELASAFLDLSRMESGRAQFRIQNVDLAELLGDCASVMHSKIDEKLQSLRLDIPAGLPQLQADRDKLKQLFLNLLSNATKYTEPGEEIMLKARQSRETVVVSVIDHGIGIPQESLPRIFEKFYRVPGVEQKAPGTGLGLSICKRIVEAHGGSIEVDSSPGQGTSFTVHLNLSSTANRK